ncbi:uncharacterized exonuclease domain-containing protein At3g15140-like isoform X2 [Triticum aestivum]|uniref:uncharacterized exonuclease domain-containing protein At3g15140-like isoform X2 n=1 Tax=Triticum aestivum TaxID=4565 RepID=UPI001D0230BF|nr:uncharacterized exonuclease domain-containing protein At3g15140-like isoform X2 [Triticum aestivum]
MHPSTVWEVCLFGQIAIYLNQFFFVQKFTIIFLIYVCSLILSIKSCFILYVQVIPSTDAQHSQTQGGGSSENIPTSEQLGDPHWPRLMLAPESPNSQRTAGISPTYQGQPHYHNQRLLDQSYHHGSSFPIEGHNASAAVVQLYPVTYGSPGVLLAFPSSASPFRQPRLKYTGTVPVHSLEDMMGRLTINNPFARMMMRTSCQAIHKAPPKEIVLLEAEPSVKQKSYALGGHNNKDVTESSSHFVVVDFKATCEATCAATCQAGVNSNRQEIIEFSSILVDAVTGQSVSAFHTYVCPIIHPELSEFCKKYNGILQTEVEAGVMLSEALQMHQAWLKEVETKNGGHLSFTVVTWGTWDCRTMLRQECLFKKVHIPHYFYQWINLKKPFTEKFGNKYWSAPVKTAVDDVGLNWRGRLTGGKSHADNKARLLEFLIRQGAKLYITGDLEGCDLLLLGPT